MTVRPAKKKRVSESVAGSHAYSPIRDSRRDFLPRKVSPRVSLRVLPRVSVRLLARLFTPKSLAKNPAESLESDYMYDSLRDSPKLVFFTRGANLSDTNKYNFVINRSFQLVENVTTEWNLISMIFNVSSNFLYFNEYYLFKVIFYPMSRLFDSLSFHCSNSWHPCLLG